MKLQAEHQWSFQTIQCQDHQKARANLMLGTKLYLQKVQDSIFCEVFTKLTFLWLGQF